jgi:hypothetical protein
MIAGAGGRWSYRSTPTIPAVNWDGSSPESSLRLVNVAWPLSTGVPLPVLAARLGETVDWTTWELDRLRAELYRGGC